MAHKHTPAPWEVNQFDDTIEVYMTNVHASIRQTQHKVIMDTWAFESEETQDDQMQEAIANMKLIAAAPEMLDALLAAQQCIRDFLEAYKNDTSYVVLDEAVKSLQNDAGKLVNNAINKALD